MGCTYACCETYFPHRWACLNFCFRCLFSPWTVEVTGIRCWLSHCGVLCSFESHAQDSFFVHPCSGSSVFELTAVSSSSGYLWVKRMSFLGIFMDLVYLSSDTDTYVVPSTLLIIFVLGLLAVPVTYGMNSTVSVFLEPRGGMGCFWLVFSAIIVTGIILSAVRPVPSCAACGQVWLVSA